VLPSDTGTLKEGIDKELIKKIATVAGVMLLIIGLCVVAMYML
jgi:Fe-S cluster biogenesis protein NfuA